MKIDRLLGIVTTLLRKDRVTAQELAEKFEVNKRTIGRDIDALCQAGIPVITHQGIGGGISIADGFRLDKSVLSAEELQSIIAALKGIGSISEQSQIERTLDKLHAGSSAVISMREPIIIDLASYYKSQLTDKIDLIKRAVLEHRVIGFDYFYEKGRITQTDRAVFCYISMDCLVCVRVLLGASGLAVVQAFAAVELESMRR